MRKVVAICLIIFFACDLGAQVNGKRNARVESQLSFLASQVPKSMMDVPTGFRRIAIFELRSDLPSTYMSKEEWRNKFMERFIALGMQIVSVPEFDDKITLRINSTDSNIHVDNRSSLTRLKANPKALSAVCEMYQVQALFSCHISLDSVNGPRVTMSLMNPGNRTIVWLKNLDMSQEIVVQPVIVSLSAGVASQRLDELRDKSTGKLLESSRATTPVLMNFSIMQLLDAERSNAFGVSLGGRIVDKTPINYGDSNLGRMGMSMMPNIGMMYQTYFKRKPTILPNYWGFVQFGVNYMYHREQGLVGFHQKIGINLTENIAVDFRFEQFLKGYNSISNNEKYDLLFDNVTYGINVSLMF